MRDERVKWKVESGKWRVESGKWRVESGKWRVESGKSKDERVCGVIVRDGARTTKLISSSRSLFPLICYLLSIICYLLSVIYYLLSIIYYLLSIICYLLSVICYLLSTICYLPCRRRGNHRPRFSSRSGGQPRHWQGCHPERAAATAVSPSPWSMHRISPVLASS